jgi:hypothetical protein
MIYRSMPGSPSLEFSTEFQFDKHRGAFLVMHNPRMTVVPDEFCFQSVNIELLKGKHVVTEVFTCDGFLMYLSNKSKFFRIFFLILCPDLCIAAETIKVGLKADISLAAAAASADIDTAWIVQGGSGLFRRGYAKNAYTPLFYLKSIQPPPPRRRETPDPNEPEGDRSVALAPVLLLG